MIETEVAYTPVYEGRFYVIEHLPARVCKEAGEELFVPDAVERIRALIKCNKAPDRMVRTPVYEYG